MGLTDEDLEGRDATSLVLRQMVFKRPKTDVELMDWMISLDNPVMTEASRAILNGIGHAQSGEVAPIRALHDLINQLKSAMLLVTRIWYLSDPET